MPNQIEEAILQPDDLIASFEERLIARKVFPDNILEVVYRQEGEKNDYYYRLLVEGGEK